MESILNTSNAAIIAFEQLAARSSSRIHCLRIKTPKKTVHSFWELFSATKKHAWLPGRDQLSQHDDWQVMCAGVAVILAAKSDTRFADIKKQALDAFGEIEVISDAPNSHFPNLRFFGGGAFVPGQPDAADIWQDFNDAQFIIPRWQYATQSHDATLQLVISAEEFQQKAQWQRELELIFEWLKTPDTLKMPATQSVNITHFSNGWETLVQNALRKIENDELQKVVVSRMSRLTSNMPFSVRRALERLETSYADCTRFAFGNTAGGIFIGATPEQLIRVSNHGHRFAADALAGSAQRTSSSDSAAVMLQNSEKERREFEFVLADIEARFVSGGIRITSDREVKVKSLKNLYHLHCAVTGVSDTPRHVLDLVTALHPTPAVCGTPTQAAADWLAHNEPQSRGWYAGPVGWFDANGDGDFAVGIRSALIKQNEAWLFAGAGIVEGSSAAIEFTETGAKLMPMLSALGAL